MLRSHTSATSQTLQHFHSLYLPLLPFVLLFSCVLILHKFWTVQNVMIWLCKSIFILPLLVIPFHCSLFLPAAACFHMESLSSVLAFLSVQVFRWQIVSVFVCLNFFSFFLSFFFFCLFRVAPMAYGGSQARGLIGAVAIGLHQSHSNTGSKLGLWPTPQLTATLDS